MITCTLLHVAHTFTINEMYDPSCSQLLDILDFYKSQKEISGTTKELHLQDNRSRLYIPLGWYILLSNDKKKKVSGSWQSI